MKPTLAVLFIVIFLFIGFSCKKENNPPVIVDQIFSVIENSTPGLVCATISASDPDGNKLIYELDEETVDFPFEIDPNIGNLKIKLTANLDYEQIQQYKFRVNVSDGKLTSSAFVTINITDQLENPNVIDQSFKINENVEGIYSIGTVKFISKGQNEEYSFSIVEGNTSNLFFMGEKSGELFLEKGEKLNFENTPDYTIKVKVQNIANPALYTITTVRIDVGDVNEKPIINDQSFSISENSQNNTEIGQINATDVDAGQTLGYIILQSTISDAINVNASTGKLFVSDKSKFDYETNKKIILSIKITDNGTGALSDTANVTVNILDVNENPVITTQKLDVDENNISGSVVGKVIANSYEGVPIEYTITAGNGVGKFVIDKNTGIISVAQSVILDYETKSSFSLTIKVNEIAKPEYSTSAIITIDINDINETPVILDQQFTAYESQPVGAILGKVFAKDPDSGQSLIFSIVAGNSDGYFSIDSSNGTILLAKPVIMNGADEINFKLSVRVKDNGANQLYSEANILVTVTKSSVPENGLVAYYPFNNNAIDESTNTFDGNVQGPILTNDRKGNANSAFTFDGINDYINLGGNIGNGIRSISLWFRLDMNIDASLNRYVALVTRDGDYDNTSEFSLAFFPSGLGGTGTPGKLRFFYSINKDNYYYIQSNNTSWQKDRWYHVVAIIDPSEGMKMYVDNIKQADTKNYYNSTDNCQLNTYIGSWGTVSYRYFIGNIDDVIFYNRALTETEVNELFNQ